MLCEGYPRQFLVYMRTVRQLEFAQDPDVCLSLLIFEYKKKNSLEIFSMMVYVDYFIMHSMKIILLMMVILIG